MKKITFLMILGALFLLDLKTFAQFASADFTVNYGYLYGSNSSYPSADDDFGGWVSDGVGNAYAISSNGTIDNTQSNIVVTKLQLSTGQVIWAKKYGHEHRGEQLVEPGANGITVGGASTRNIAIDSNGDIYIICNIHTGFYRSYVAKLSPTNGSIIWEKSWKNVNNELGISDVVNYSLDVQAGKVFVAGTTDNMDLLLVYDASNGSLVSTTRLDLVAGSGDKAYAVRASADGLIVYIAGWTAKNFQDGFLAKLSSSGTVLEWFDYIDFPSASRITDLDLDASGNVYLNSDIHGASTYLELMKVAPDGTLMWEKAFGIAQANGQYNGTNVDVIGNAVYITGRAGLSDNSTYVDSQFGDGMFLKFDLNGSLLNKYFYFTGTSISDMAADWVKGIIEYNGNIYLGGSIYPKTANYTGSWFVAPDHSGTDAGIVLTKETVPAAFITNTPGFDAGLTMDTVADFNSTAVHEDITNAAGTTFGTTQLYFWGLSSPTNVSNNEMVELSVYPNPTDKVLYITVGDKSKNAEISIMNVAGQILTEKSFNNIDIKSIDISNLKAGIYFVNIKTETFSTRRKIIVN